MFLNRRRGPVAILSVLAALAAVSPVSARVVGVDADGNYWEASPETGMGTMLGTTGISNLGALAADNSATLYTADRTALYTLDFDTGAATMVTPLNLGTQAISIEAMAFDNKGDLYAANRNSTGNSDLWKIDLGTGDGTMVGSIDQYITAMDFRGGVMFAYSLGNGSAVGPGLGVLDMTEGTFSDLEPTEQATLVHSVSFKSVISGTESCCELFAAGMDLFGMDPATGEAISIGPIDAVNGTMLVGIEGFVPVPEPTSFGLILAGVVGLSWLRGRRS